MDGEEEGIDSRFQAGAQLWEARESPRRPGWLVALVVVKPRRMGVLLIKLWKKEQSHGDWKLRVR